MPGLACAAAEAAAAAAAAIADCGLPWLTPTGRAPGAEAGTEAVAAAAAAALRSTSAATEAATAIDALVSCELATWNTVPQLSMGLADTGGAKAVAACAGACETVPADAATPAASIGADAVRPAASPRALSAVAALWAKAAPVTFTPPFQASLSSRFGITMAMAEEGCMHEAE